MGTVTIGEFVRVMTGGKVVTDDLWIECRKHVNDAVRKLEAAKSDLGKVGLHDDAITSAIAEADDGLKNSMAADRQGERYKLLEPVRNAVVDRAAQAQKRTAENLVKLKFLTDLAEKTRKVIARNVQDVNKIDNKDLAQKLVANLEALEASRVSAAVVGNVDTLQSSIDELLSIRTRAGEKGKDLARKVSNIEMDLAVCTAKLKDIEDDDFRESIITALEGLKDDAGLAADGAVPAGETATISYDGRPCKETAMDLLRGVEGAVKAVKAAIGDPDSQERELLEAFGADNFTKRMRQTFRTMIAYGASQKPLSFAEAFAVNSYLGNDFRQMNALSRGGYVMDENDPDAEKKRDKIALANKICAQGLEKLPPYPKVAWPTHRGEYAWNQDMIESRFGLGKDFVTQTFWSTGAGKAEPQGTGTPSFQHRVYGISGKDVAHLAKFPGEGFKYGQAPNLGKGEVLFPPTAKFKVRSRTFDEQYADKLDYGAKAHFPAVVINTEVREYT